MRLILVGPPGAGKGTQAETLVKNFGVTHVSSGDMFRAAISEQTRLGRQVQRMISRGDLVPDEITIAMVMERIAKPDCQNGFLLDGFPRTETQARALDEALAEVSQSIDSVILLEVPDELIVERITGRRINPETGKIYHIKHNPPPEGVEVQQREDDTAEKCRNRLDKYHAETAAVALYYAEKSALLRVNGVGTPAEVSERVVEALEASKA